MAASGFPKERLVRELENELRKLTGVWFPRSLDREYGGFLCDFDHRWRPRGSQSKMLEYQARQTIAAARSAAHFADIAHLRAAAAHGFSFLKEQMWDRDFGGWYRLLDRTATPLEGATKHGHGASYAISACVACHELTGDPACLALATSAFAWLEKHAHDDENGGYFVFYRRDGSPITSQDGGLASGQDRDAIGTPIGYKDANTTSDLLKCFADLYRAWPDALLRKRLEELLSIMCHRLIVAPGVMHMYLRPDWTALPDLVRYGQVIRSASHLLSASQALNGAADPAAARTARSMVDTMLRIAWDPHRGGFHFAGSSFGPTRLEGTAVLVRSKSWWAQADGLKALLAMARLHPEANDYAGRFAALWEYVKKYLIDWKHGGWFVAGLDENPEARKRPKATIWKDASHEMEALLDSLLMLNGS